MMIFTIGNQRNLSKEFVLFSKRKLVFSLKEASLKIIRPPASIARFKMLHHVKRTPSIWNKR